MVCAYWFVRENAPVDRFPFLGDRLLAGAAKGALYTASSFDEANT
jgi:hypothetical protein